MNVKREECEHPHFFGIGKMGSSMAEYSDCYSNGFGNQRDISSSINCTKDNNQSYTLPGQTANEKHQQSVVDSQFSFA